MGPVKGPARSGDLHPESLPHLDHRGDPSRDQRPAVRAEGERDTSAALPRGTDRSRPVAVSQTRSVGSMQLAEINVPREDQRGHLIRVALTPTTRRPEPRSHSRIIPSSPPSPATGRRA
jgi:hypothetical protein